MKIAAFFIVILGLVNADGETGTSQPLTGKPLSSDEASGCAYMYSSALRFYNDYQASPQNEKPEKVKCVVTVLLQIVTMIQIHMDITPQDFLPCLGLSSTAVTAFMTGDMNGFYVSISVDQVFKTVHIFLQIIFAHDGKDFDDMLVSVNIHLGITQDEDCSCSGNSPTEIIEKYKDSLWGGLVSGTLTLVNGVVTLVGHGVSVSLNTLLSGWGNNLEGAVHDLDGTVFSLVNNAVELLTKGGNTVPAMGNNVGVVVGSLGKTMPSKVNTAAGVGVVTKSLDKTASGVTNTGKTGVLSFLGL